MKAGDIKKFLSALITSDNPENVDPRQYNINDKYLLDMVRSYKNGDTSEELTDLARGLITTEELTVHRRVAVLTMVRDTLKTLAQGNIDDSGKERLKGLLTSYFI